jgi:hypothetical protein
MRFHCVNIFDWLSDRRYASYIKKTHWHKKFTWFPTRMTDGDGECVWFETIWRKGECDSYNGTWYWSYVTPEFYNYNRYNDV